MSQDRAAQRLHWARQHSPTPFESLEPASSDASFRSYWRPVGGAVGWLLMDAPPEHEPLDAWLEIGARLRRAGLRAPEVHAVNRQHGFVLLEDFGSQAYLPSLRAGQADRLYAEALVALSRMQSVSTAGLPHYDPALLRAELELMPVWFLDRHLGCVPPVESLAPLFECLIDAVLEQPRVFVHRDYHSRNLMCLPEGGPGILDFQDAVCGPLTYDLVSLLRDCYLAWPQQQVEAWLRGWWQAGGCERAGGADFGMLLRWFDLTGLQRHLKVLGIFARLYYRDGKPGYLADLPRVFDYVRLACARQPQFRALAELLESAVGGRALDRPR